MCVMDKIKIVFKYTVFSLKITYKGILKLIINLDETVTGLLC